MLSRAGVVVAGDPLEEMFGVYSTLVSTTRLRSRLEHGLSNFMLCE
jgi:hypothetical protein